MTKPFALIVEDEDDLISVFSMGLNMLGFETHAVNNGEKAIAYEGKEPVLILLDYHLPKFSGLDILETWKTNGRFSQTKIIMVTANHDLLYTLRGKADMVLLKPLGIRQLRKALRELKLID